MQLVQRHIINKNHPDWDYFDKQCFLAKNLFNLTNYEMRQHYFVTRSIMSFTKLYHKVSKTEAYYALPNTKVAKQVIRRIHKAWISYREAHKDWIKHPHKYLGEPRIPKYKDKLKGRYVLIYPDETVSKPLLREGIVKLTPSPVEFKSGLTQVNEVRVVPKSGCYVVEIVYKHSIKANSLGSQVAGIDLGLVNLVTLTTNQSGVKPLLIKGGALKAINTYYNKQKAKFQSDLETRHKSQTSNRIKALTHKRNCRVENYLHTSSRRVIDWCLKHQIGTLIIGKNEVKKQSINIGKKNNQQFVNIPHCKLIEMISYKAELVGIKVVLTEESYTSKSSFLDNDPVPQYGDKKPKFSGKRVKRGLYVSGAGRLINSDVNGSLNIIRKVKPDVYPTGDFVHDQGLRALPFMPVVLDPLRTHDFLQVA